MRSLFLYILIIVAFIACTNNTKNDSTLGTNTDTVAKKEVAEQQQIKQVFYNVPSPVEMVQIIQNAGAQYNKELLNPYTNVDNYITTEDLALNLGVYGADLSYNRIFDQMQESLHYLVAIRKISDQLKIPQEEGSFAISRFEENLENRDSLLKVITETYANADIYLKENKRESTATLIILGGWIEALYIASHLVDEQQPDQIIMERIAEQKYSLETIAKLIDAQESEFVTVQELKPKIKALQVAFSNISIESTKGTVETNKENKSTKIGGKSQVNVSYSNIVEIKTLITDIRNQIIGKS